MKGPDDVKETRWTSNLGKYFKMVVPEELYQKDLDVPDNPDSVVAHLEPDILESEVKWVLESMANNKVSGTI